MDIALLVKICLDGSKSQLPSLDNSQQLLLSNYLQQYNILTDCTRGNQTVRRLIQLTTRYDFVTFEHSPLQVKCTWCSVNSVIKLAQHSTSLSCMIHHSMEICKIVTDTQHIPWMDPTHDPVSVLPHCN